MINQFSRSALMFGYDGIEKLKNSTVLVFGIGGVGGHLTESLARCGVGKLILVDNDTISLTNINRQIVALHSTIGKYKVDVMKERILDINPNCDVQTHKLFVLPDTDKAIFNGVDYVVDAIDTVSAKLFIAEVCKDMSLPLISAMGCGNKLDPTKLKIEDIFKTHTCPLCRTMRQELKKRGFKKLKVLFSTEEVCKRYDDVEVEAISEDSSRRSTPASNPFVPSTAGLIMSSQIIKDLIAK